MSDPTTPPQALNDKTKALIDAIETANECWHTDEHCVCVPCWSRVIRAAEAVAPRKVDVKL